MERCAGTERAFTLVEILVVAGILVFFAAVGIAGFGRAMDITKAQVTQVRLQKIDTAIDAFHAKYGEWPPDPQQLPGRLGGWSLPVGTTWYEFMSRGYAQARMGGEAKFEEGGAWLEFEARCFDAGGTILDAWQNPVRIEVDPGNGTVLVWSLGKDGRDGSGDELYSF